MLDKYKDIYMNAFNILNNEIINNKVSHAYLVDENNSIDGFQFVLSFVKSIFCMNIIDDYKKEIVCSRIDNGNYPELVIIEPDGVFIKKQQVLDLQKKFSLVSLENNRRIYIIRDCDKMRPETANSLLKFLEEPDNNIVAILMTNNYNNVLATLISRCQYIKLNGSNNIKEMDKKIVDIDNFIDAIDRDGMYAIVSLKDDINNLISLKDREYVNNFFDLLVFKYIDKFKKIINSSNVMDNDILKYSNIINDLYEIKNSIKYNVNLTLLFDTFIVRVGGYDEISRC